MMPPTDPFFMVPTKVFPHSFEIERFSSRSLDTLHVALITHALYYYVISNYGNASAIDSAVWSLIAQVFLTCTIEVIIRGFFARRVWLMTNCNNYFLVCITLPSLLSFATGFGAAGRAFGIRNFESFRSVSYLFYLSLAAGVVSDVLIAGQLCLYLLRSRTGVKNTDSTLNVLMLYTINTTLLTTYSKHFFMSWSSKLTHHVYRICSIACLITFAIWPQDFIYIAIYFSMSELYLNSLLATLNNRTALSEKFTGVTVTDLTTAATHRPGPESAHSGQQTAQHGSQTSLSATVGTTTLDADSEDHHGLPIWYLHHKVSLDTIATKCDKENEKTAMAERQERFSIPNFFSRTGLKLHRLMWFKRRDP
ncbi:hypothetical protein D9615_002201 [Tricholomella constricta]|uniref:DUF6534 domain-containing protein n=1 Tax=Tricholomella constricta TaxID=117010 RepID=A0A8H5HLY8_9AGAR|nr:hypothetical protein D9615_002201 [Tricholomella constricta]